MNALMDKGKMFQKVEEGQKSNIDCNLVGLTYWLTYFLVSLSLHNCGVERWRALAFDLIIVK